LQSSVRIDGVIIPALCVRTWGVEKLLVQLKRMQLLWKK